MAESRVSDELWNEFHQLVNMTSRELEEWLRTDSAGEVTEPAPEDTGHELGEHVVHILGKRLPEYRRWYDPANPAYADKYHDGILQADALIAKIFAALRERGLLEDAVVAVTSDHGEALGEERQLGHGGPPIDAVVRVPLLIFDSEGFPYDKRPLASVTDLAPTLLDRIGAPIPEHWTGVSLARAGTRKYTLMQAQDRYAVIGSFGPELYKYHYRVSDRAGELVRLGPGGSESKPLPPEAHAAVLQDLRAELFARIKQSP